MGLVACLHPIRLQRERLHRSTRFIKFHARHSKAHGKERVADAQVKVLEAKAKVDKAKELKQQKFQLDRYATLHFAGWVAKRIRPFVDDKVKRAALDERLEKLLEKGLKGKGTLCPSLYRCTASLLKNLGVCKIGATKDKVYGSSAMELILFGGRQEKAPNPYPRPALRKILNRLLPSYDKLFGTLHSADSLLTSNYGQLDSAFVEAVWRYSGLVGEKFFPVGLFGKELPQAFKDDVASSIKPSSSTPVGSYTIGGSTSSGSAGPPPSVREKGKQDEKDTRKRKRETEEEQEKRERDVKAKEGRKDKEGEGKAKRR